MENRLSSYGAELPGLTRFMLGLHPVHCGLLMASLMAGVLWIMEWTAADAGLVRGMRELVASWS
ncbi:MAG: hypothetical protein HY748_00295 [Elusimicrobia bacterium]|nr:hypothetical protein [Elusimicrobiota bacterium]